MFQEELDALKGSKCQAPHKQNWGGHSYHNALIVDIQADDNIQDMTNILVCLFDTYMNNIESLGVVTMVPYA